VNVLPSKTAGVSKPAINRHIIQSRAKARNRRPSEAAGSIFGPISQLMRATLAVADVLKHRCNKSFTTFSLFSTRFYLSETVQSRPKISRIKSIGE